jgi:hypothetical protein
MLSDVSDPALGSVRSNGEPLWEYWQIKINLSTISIMNGGQRVRPTVSDLLRTNGLARKNNKISLQADKSSERGNDGENRSHLAAGSGGDFPLYRRSGREHRPDNRGARILAGSIEDRFSIRVKT